MAEARDIKELEDALLQEMIAHVETTLDTSEDQSLRSRFVLLPYSAQKTIFMGLMKKGTAGRIPTLCGTPPYPFLDRDHDYMNLSANGLTAGRVNLAMQSDIPSRRYFGKQYRDNEGRHFRVRSGIELKGENTLFVLLPNMKQYRFPNVEDQLTLSPTNAFVKLTNLTTTYRIRVKSVRTDVGLHITAALIYTIF